MNKKGAIWVGYVLAVMFFVALAIMAITWSRERAEEMSESTVTMVSGKLDCQEIRISATPSGDCRSVEISNKGMLNIIKVVVTYDGVERVETEQLNVVDGVVIAPSASNTFSKAELLPVVEVDGELFGCQDKTLIVDCPP